MLESLTTIIGYVLVLLGGFFILTGAVGIWRMPDIFARLHPAGVVDSLGVPLCLGGLMCIAGLNFISAKLFLILLFLLLTSPTACLALAKSSWISGLKPYGSAESDTSPAADRVKPQPDTTAIVEGKTSHE